MSDEEKKAIEELWHFDCAYNREIKIVLNLIEKQSKEIEELKRYEEGYKLLSYSLDNYTKNDKIKAKIERKFLEAKGLYERGVQPQAQYTMKLLRDLEESLLEKE